MTGKIELALEDESGEPLSIADARIYRDRSGVVMEDADGYRTLIVTEGELNDMIGQMDMDDPPIYIYDATNDQQVRLDIPRVVDAKGSYLRGDITEIELEQQVERALEQYGDPEGVYDFGPDS